MPENTSGVPARGHPIDTTPLPDWAQPYFTPDQLGLDRGLLWILLVYKARTLGDSATNLAQRYYVHSVGKTVKKAWPSIRVLAADLELSTNTVMTAQRKLEADGWLIKEEGPGGRNAYVLAWPGIDCLAPGTGGPLLCGAVKANGSLCTRRAGWGTRHRGEGKCKLHDPELSQPLRQPEGESVEQVSQPLRTGVSVVEAPVSQPLRQGVATVETEYVRECVTGVHQESDEGFSLSRAEVEVSHALEPEEDQEFRRGDGTDTPDGPPLARTTAEEARALARAGVARAKANGPRTTARRVS